MMVAMVASEMEPFAKTGGLADVAGALPVALGKLGLRVHVFIPRYSCVKETGSEVAMANGVRVHFVDHESFFSRSGLYGESNGDYPDNLERFGFFCRESLLKMKQAGIRPDLIHAHDWQAALAVVYLHTQFREDPFFSGIKSVLTIHNLAYQGLFPKEQYPKLGLPWDHFGINGLEFYDKVNLLKGGLIFSRSITTVSPTYSREIQTADQGEGLDGVLRMRSRDLVGILNGIDEETWNPATDQALSLPYDYRQLEKKARIKALLQKEVGLPVDPKAFLIGMVTRLASQKGVDLLVETLPQLTGLKVQLLILGSGDQAIQQALEKACAPSKWVRLRLGFDQALAHRIYAGADAFLMPSRYEPCGLGQMISLRYGTIPIVRLTGGLSDTITDVEENPQGNGFCFRPYDPQALLEAVSRALGLYQDKRRWEDLQRRGMMTDFSWEASAKEYRNLYERL